MMKRSVIYQRGVVILTFGVIAWLGNLSSATALSSQMRDAEPTPAFSTALALETFDYAWELVRDTHYDENLNGIDWDGIRTELRPQAATAKDNHALRAILNDMVGRLDLSHFGIIPSEQADALADPGAAANEAAETNSENTAAKDGGNADSKVAAETKETSTGTVPATKIVDGDASQEQKPASVKGVGRPDIDFDKQTGAMRMKGALRRERVKQERSTARGESDGGLGIDIRVLEGEVVVTKVLNDGTAFAAGIRPGWVIDSIDHQSMSGLLKVLGGIKEGRELDLNAWQVISGMLHGTVGSKIDLTVLDGQDVASEMTLKRAARDGVTIKFGNLPPMRVQTESYWLASENAADLGGARIGVIGFSLWMFPMIQPFGQAMEDFADADGIIIDLRGNLGGIGGLVMRTGGYFIDQKLPLGTMRQRGQELHFNVNPQLVSASMKRTKPFAGPVVILIDGASASTSEIFAAGMKAHERVRVIGTTSAGAALPAAMDKLPNGDVLLHAIADFVDPNGYSVEGGGVVPHDEVELTRASLLAGRELQLEAAAVWLSANRDFEWEAPAEK